MPVPSYASGVRDRTVTGSPVFAACRAMAAGWVTAQSLAGQELASSAWAVDSGRRVRFSVQPFARP